jgi:hypothetical protein
MTKSCPSCGFVSNAEARFCRMCGALLPRAGEIGDDSVSPSASTVPLSDNNPTTGELSPHDTGSPNRAHTAHIRSSEMEEFLRRAPGDNPPASAPDDAPQLAHAAERTEPTPDDEHPLTIHVRPFDGEARANATPSTRPADAHDSTPHVDSSDSSRHVHSRDSSRLADSNTSARLAVARDANETTITNVAPTNHENDNARRVDADARRTDAAASRADSDAPSASLSNSNALPSNSNARARRSTEDRALRLWAGAAVFCVVALLVAAGVVLAWYAARRLRRPANANGVAASAPATDEAKRAADAKLREADALLVAGRAGEAVARLREAAALNPVDAEPHRRLARLLIEEGARRTAIEELQSVVRLDANDAAAWRELASAQSVEGLYADAAESYHNLFGLSSESTSDDRLQLAYADALRLSGRASEAQTLYRRLAASPLAEVARASREQLAAANAHADDAKNANAARAADAVPANSSSNNATRDARTIETARVSDANNNNSVESRPSPPALPASASSKDHFERGVELWRTNRAAALVEFGAAAQGGSADASYYLGLNLAEGRDPRALKRAELVAALTYFQRARRSRFSADARRYEDALGREYDRRRNDER